MISNFVWAVSTPCCLQVACS